MPPRCRAFAKDRLFELVGRRDTETHRGIGVNEAIRVRRIDVEKPGVRGSNIGQNAGSPVALIAASVTP
jgi:hypothetical protein